MPRGIKGSGKAAKKVAVPRRKREAKLLIEQSNETLFPGDEYFRKDALYFVKELHAGHTVTILQLLEDADKVYFFLKGQLPPPYGTLGGSVMKEPIPKPDQGIPESRSHGEDGNHKSKFEEIAF